MLQLLVKNFTNIVIGMLLLFGAAFFYKWYNSEKLGDVLYKELLGKDEAFKKLSSSSALLAVQFRDQQALQDKAKAEWAKERDALKGKILLLGNTTYTTGGNTSNQGGSDLTTDTFKFNELSFDDGYPLGNIKLMNDGSVVKSVYKHRLDVKLIVTKLDDGKLQIGSKSSLILLSKHSKEGMVHDMAIESGSVLVDPTERQTSRMYWYNPKFNLGANLSLTGISPAGVVTLASYGPTKNDSTFKFLGIGAQANDFGLVIIPAMYRPFSMFSNTYVTVGANVNLQAQVNMFLGLMLGL